MPSGRRRSRRCSPPPRPRWTRSLRQTCPTSATPRRVPEFGRGQGAGTLQRAAGLDAQLSFNSMSCSISTPETGSGRLGRLHRRRRHDWLTRSASSAASRATPGSTPTVRHAGGVWTSATGRRRATSRSTGGGATESSGNARFSTGPTASSPSTGERRRGTPPGTMHRLYAADRRHGSDRRPVR